MRNSINLAPLSALIPPFWHPSLISINLFKCLDISNNNSTDDFSYLNDVIQVFTKLLYDGSDDIKGLNQKDIVQLLLNELITFSQLVYQIYSGNLKLARQNIHNEYNMITRKLIYTFSHPFAQSRGLEVVFYMTSMLTTMMSLAKWTPPSLTDSDTTTTATSEQINSDKNKLTTASNISDQIKLNFNDKGFDQWAQHSVILSNIIYSILDTSSLLLSPSTNPHHHPQQQQAIHSQGITSSIYLNGTILSQLCWSKSQTLLFKTLVMDGISALSEVYEKNRYMLNTGIFDNAADNSDPGKPFLFVLCYVCCYVFVYVINSSLVLFLDLLFIYIYIYYIQ